MAFGKIIVNICWFQQFTIIIITHNWVITSHDMPYFYLIWINWGIYKLMNFTRLSTENLLINYHPDYTIWLLKCEKSKLWKRQTCAFWPEIHSVEFGNFKAGKVYAQVPGQSRHFPQFHHGPKIAKFPLFTRARRTTYTRN